MRKLLFLWYLTCICYFNMHAMHVAHLVYKKPLSAKNSPAPLNKQQSEHSAQAQYWSEFFHNAEAAYQRYLASKKSSTDLAKTKVQIIKTCKKLLRQKFPQESRFNDKEFLEKSAAHECAEYLATRAQLEKEGWKPQNNQSKADCSIQ